MAIREQDIYGIIGEDGFTRLVAAFYRRVPVDPILSRMYPADDLPGAEERLRGFLIYRFGGPWTYIQQRGHPRLGMRHAPFAIDTAARSAWMSAMRAALDEVRLSPEAAAVLLAFFEHTASFLINRPEER